MLFAVLATLLVVLGWSGQAAAATQVGFIAQAYPSSVEASGGAATGQKPESKLWYQDGNWWAAMATPAAGSHHIYLLSGTTWVDTGVEIDPRPETKEDILTLGSKIYFLSRDAVGPSKLRRFSYVDGRYQLDAGFPVDLPVPKAEAMTIARDTTGTFWITYEAGRKTFVVRSNGSDTSWGTPFVVPVAPANGLSSDDITAVISFRDAAGPAIGVFWSNHPSQADYFAVHRDGAADSAWTVETSLSGLNQADDHMDLRTYNGRVYAAVKTSTTIASEGLIKLLVRSDDGQWAGYSVSPYSDRNTRPIVEIDPTSGQVYVFMTIGEGARARGIIYKQSSLTSISFPTTSTLFMQGPNLEAINNSTSDKNVVSLTGGIVVMASDGSRYWWNRIGGTNTSPSATAQSLIVSGQGATNLTLRGGDAETCELSFTTVSGPAHGVLGPLGAAPCSPGAPNADSVAVSYTPTAGYAGPDSFTYQVSDGTLTATATVTITVNSPPSATPVAVTTRANTPVTVTLTGSDVETCPLTFAIVSGPGAGSLGPVSPGSCTPGTSLSSATVEYRPAPGYIGSDSFSFRVSDGTDSATAVVTVTVSG